MQQNDKTANAAQPAAAPSSAPEAAAVATKGPHQAPGVVKKTGGAWNVDPDKIAIRPGWNIRGDMGDIPELAAQIEAKLQRDPESGGLIHPLGLLRLAPADPLAEDGKFLFEVVRGHRRTTGIRLLRERGVEFPFGVAATILDKGMDIRTATVEMFVENTGKPLLPYERALGFKRLRDGDPDLDMPPMTIAEIEAATGFSDNTINSSLALLEGDEELVEAMRSGEIAPGAALEIAVHARGDRAAQKELVRLAKDAAPKSAPAKKGGTKKVADKAARRRLKDAIKAQQTKKHAAKGKQLKVRALSDADLSDLGAKQGARVVALLAALGKAPDFDVDAWVAKDDKLALAAAYGALQALKAAAGVKTDLAFGAKE